MSNTRTRHMVDISDYAWDKLERLASRVDAEAYLYKGRPRYGKLIELAIEKLEDSTMEWTVEEVVIEEVPAAWWDDTDAEAKPAEWDGKKGWWKGDKLDAYKPGQAAQDMALYGNAYIGTDYASGTDSHVTLKPIKASSVSVTPIKIKPIDTDLLKETTEAVAAAMGIHLEKELDKAFVSGKAKPSDTPMLDAFKKNAATISYTGSVATGAAESTEKLAASFKKAEQDAQGFASPDPATIHEADVWTYPSNGNFTSVGTTLKLCARTDKEWTSEQVTQAQDAVSYAISGAAWFVKPFHTSFVGGTGFFEYSSVINMHHSETMDFVIERAKSSLRHVLVKIGLSGTKQHPPLHKIKAEYDAKKPANPVPLVMYKMSQPGYIELTGTITQALSAPQYDFLRGFAYAAFAEFSSDKGENALSVYVKGIPWNKLWISATYADPSKLLKKLPDVGEAMAKRVEAWLLQGNFIGPIAKDLF